jgi:hypothetical protein
MLCYLEKEHEEYVARGEEPPFGLEDLLRRYTPSPPNPEVSAPPSSLRQQKIHQSILLSHQRMVEDLCVVAWIFKLHVGCGTFMFV